MPARGGRLLPFALALAALGCSPGYRSYRVELRAPRDARIDVASSWDPKVAATLGCPETDGAPDSANEPCKARSLSSSSSVWLRDVDHVYTLERGVSGETTLTMRDTRGERRSGTLVDGRGTMTLAASRAGWSFPGIYLGTARTTGSDVELRGSHVVYGQGDSGHSGVAYDFAFRTPVSNVRSMTEVIDRPRGILLFGLGISTVIAVGGAAIVATEVPDGFRYGVGLPVLSVGVLAALYFGYTWLLPAREHRELSPAAVRVP